MCITAVIQETLPEIDSLSEVQLHNESPTLTLIDDGTFQLTGLDVTVLVIHDLDDVGQVGGTRALGEGTLSRLAVAKAEQEGQAKGQAQHGAVG